MTSNIPQDVASALGSLGESDKECVLKYIQSLQSKIGENVDSAVEEDTKEDADEDANEEDVVDGFSPPYYDAKSGKEDYDSVADYKQQATDAKSDGKWENALDFYSKAVVSAPPSALLYANRAIALEKLGHYKAADKDCNCALEINPDSVKALKVRGKLRFKHLEDWHGALSDLNQAQSIDFDPDVAETLKELTKLRLEEEKQEAQERIKKEEKLKKRASEIKRAQEEAREEEAKAARGGGMPGGMGGMPGGMGGMPGGMGGMPGGMGGMPGGVGGMPGGMGGMPGGMGGMPGGMGGMPGGMGDMPGGMGGMPGGMAGIMEMFQNDPELQEAMKNPKVMAAFSELMNSPGGPMGLMSNPGKITKMMSDPEVGPVLQKIMGKMMGGGGMPGMPGGMPGGMGGGSNNNDDDIPDLGDLPDLH